MTTTMVSLDLGNFRSWQPQQFATYMRDTHNLGAYYEAIISNGIGGDTAPQLTENDLKELGINSIGDRKRFMSALDELKKGSRKAEREKILWQDTEALFFSCYDRNCSTCCGCCPVDPAEYKLTNHHLVIKTVMPSRCGPFRCCFGHEYHVDNIDLTYITSGDIKSEAPPCFQECFCCGSGRDRVNLTTSSEGTKYLVLKKGEGERVNRIILNQIEEAQKIERD